MALLAFTAKTQAQSSANPPINRPEEVPARLSRCWTPPLTDKAIMVTVRLSFTRAGAVIGEPRIAFVKAPDPETRLFIASSILAAVKACTPLNFAPAFGATIAGRIFAIRYNAFPISGRQRNI
jgi:hypothetical protein